jgi:hypothetical protein
LIGWKDLGAAGFLVEVKHFSLDFLDFPCDTNTMNIVSMNIALNTFTTFTSSNFSVRLQEADGRSHATELAKAGVASAI